MRPWAEYLPIQALHNLVGAYSACVQFVAFLTILLITISSLDDLFVDVSYWSRITYRRLFVKGRYAPVTEADLRAKPEQPFAIMIPAWREDDVIAAMVENLVATLDYSRYVIFIGVYPNDPDTIGEVERLRRRYPQLVRVEVDHAGPTSKADCLNAVVTAILKYEDERATKFAGMIMHDCEDVLHPVELLFFNWLVARKDMIQLPVVSLERGYPELIAGHYMDEFAEWHAKDLVVREAIANAVPSAGVGTCFSRRAIQALLDDSGVAFNTSSLTEDYDIAARLASKNMSSIIAHFPVTYRVPRTTLFGYGKSRTISIVMPLCVREYFPDTLRGAYRQKARWIIGIALQGWSQLGWSKSASANYFLVRDRKSLFTPTLAVLAYFILVNLAIFHFWNGAAAWGFRSPIPYSRLIAWLLLFNGFSLLARVVQRIYFVNRLYGWEHALISIPRLFVGALINLLATGRAIKAFLTSLFFGVPLIWDKTMHQYPTSLALAKDRRRLGEILRDWRKISAADLDKALVEQGQHPGRLGDILVGMGLADEDTIADAVGVQSDLTRIDLDLGKAVPMARSLPALPWARWRVLPMGRTPQGVLILAVGGRLDPAGVTAFTGETGAEPVQRIATESDIAAGLERLGAEQSAAAATDMSTT